MQKRTHFLNKIILIALLVLFNSNSLSAMMDEAALEGDQERQLAKIYRFSSGMGYERLTNAQKAFLRPLYWCTCPNFSIFSRLRSKRKLLKTIKKSFPPEQNSENNPLVYVSYQSGLLLQDFIIISKLIYEGYKYINIYLIDYINKKEWTGEGNSIPLGFLDELGFPDEQREMTHIDVQKAQKRLASFLNTYKNMGILNGYSISYYSTADDFIHFINSQQEQEDGTKIGFDMLISIHNVTHGPNSIDMIKIRKANQRLGRKNFFSLRSTRLEIDIIKHENNIMTREKAKTQYEHEEVEKWITSQIEEHARLVSEGYSGIQEPICIAIAENNIPEIINLINQGVNLNFYHIIFSILKQNRDIVNAIIEAVNLKDINASELASIKSNLIYNDCQDAIKILDDKIENQRLQTAAENARRFQDIDQSLRTAIKEEDLKKVIWLIDVKSADPRNLSYEDMSYLLRASQYNIELSHITELFHLKEALNIGLRETVNPEEAIQLISYGADQVNLSPEVRNILENEQEKRELERRELERRELERRELERRELERRELERHELERHELKRREREKIINILKEIPFIENKSVLPISERTNTYLEEDVLSEILSAYRPGSPGFQRGIGIIKSNDNRNKYFVSIRRFISSNLLSELERLDYDKLEEARNNIYKLYQFYKQRIRRR